MPRLAPLVVTALAGFATLTGCAGPAAAEGRRIVSAGGAVTEILYRLGKADEIVGVDTTSQYPPEALAQKPQVGYVRALGAEGLMSLNPTMIVAIDGAGPPDTLRIVAEGGVDVVRVPDATTADGVVERIRRVADAVQAGAAGAILARDVSDAFDRLAVRRAAIAAKRRVLVILSLQNGRPMVAGEGTSGAAMIDLAGAVNAAGTVQGWKALSDEGVIAAAPDAIVMVDRGPDATGADPLALPAIAATPAGLRKAVVRMDSLYLLGFGPRTPAAAADLMTSLYPEREAGKP